VRPSLSDRWSLARSVCWSIHALTLSGICVGLVSLVAVMDGSPRLAVGMLLLAMVIDGLDGPLARRADIRQVLPRFNGETLDIAIDYVTCVIVPAAFAWQFELVPHSAVGVVALGLLVATSALWFARTDMMTTDKWFRGFPAAWNMVIPTLWLLGASAGVTVGVLVVLSLLQLTDIEFAHPVQVDRWRAENLTAMSVWTVGLLVATIRWPETTPWTNVVLVIGPTWMALSTAVHDIERRRAVVAST
jgi:phosphatidylcholine synthase